LLGKKSSKSVALIFLATLLVAAALMMGVYAQSQATVMILTSVGGSTDPAAGTYQYNDGQVVTLTATPDSGNGFSNWIISTPGATLNDPNPTTTVTVAAGTTYTIQAVFQPLSIIPSIPYAPFSNTTSAVIGILASAGGTVSPAPGLYYMANASSFQLTATPSSGWQFSHWVIYGPNLSHGGYPYTATPTDNPYTVDHGYGNRYDYQAVFTPTGSTEPTPTGGTGGVTPTPTGIMGGLTTDTGIIIALIVVIVIILIAFGVFASRRRR
jgi:hypothetical protein